MTTSCDDHYQKRRLSLLKILFCSAIIFTSQIAHLAQAQDILRSRAINTNQHHSNQNSNNINQNNPLANIQLPPQLASLTPQQLHQLAQLRELQLQQQAAQQQGGQAENVAPAPIGAEVLAPTAQPSSSSSTESHNIERNLGSQSNNNHHNNNNNPQHSNNNNNHESERLDDGSYNESGSEMEGVIQSGGDQPASGPSRSSASASSQASSSESSAQATGDSASANSDASNANGGMAAAPTFEVNWNKCPQLEPSESEKNKKTQVITKCLQSAPIPTNLTRENVEMHREQIATCALKVEGWFDNQGNYRYEKAENEIRGKKLEPAIEIQVLKFHVACKDEANKKFPRDQNKLIDQVQLYQACMDYYISIVCEIEVSVDQ